jgi:hypothetical protein
MKKKKILILPVILLVLSGLTGAMALDSSPKKVAVVNAGSARPSPPAAASTPPPTTTTTAPTPSPAPTPAPTPSAPAKPDCSQQANDDSAYDETSGSVISMTQSGVAAAQSAYKNGLETYDQSATQINTEYTNANASLAQIYAGYLQTLQGCPASFSPPYVYQMMPLD